MANIDAAIYRMVLDLEDAFANETAETIRKAGRQFSDVVEAYRDTAKNGDMLARANSALAAKMHEAVLSAYQSNVVAVRAAPEYRQNDPKRHSGELLPVLERDDFVIGTQSGIGFINVRELDNAGKFWARLNYGAGPNIGNTVHAFPAPNARVRFGSNQGVSLRLTSPPSPNFSVPQKMPVGHFNRDGEFAIGVPKGKKKGDLEDGIFIIKSKPSRSGIGARRFLDAGLVALADNFRDVYVGEIDRTSRQAASRAKNVRVR